MASASDEHIKTSLACAQQLTTNVCQIAGEFKPLRRRLLQSLQPEHSRNARGLQRSISTSDSNQSLDGEETIDERFQHVSDTMLDEHAMLGGPTLVVFGPNSSGKTSFIQRFLGIGYILPSDIGPVTARIVQLTYASGKEACFRVYETIEKVLVRYQGNLSDFFQNELDPNWDGIRDALLPHVQRPDDMDENSIEFHEWAKCFIEVALPSNVLSLGIDIYDTPGFLSNNREQMLTENLHKLVKRIQPTLLFLYDNPTIIDTDQSCFLAMKNALGSLERVPTFFLNTKADCITMANDYSLDDDPDNVSPEEFEETLHEKRQYCYGRLLLRQEMASEKLGRLHKSVDECTFFDICTIPRGFDPWERYTNLINTATFQRIVKFAVESYSAPSLALARDMLATVEDYFDLVVSTTLRLPRQWEALLHEAVEWGRNFFDAYEKIVPTVTDELIIEISHLFEERRSQIAYQAALMIRTDDPIDTLLQDNAKRVRDYIWLAVQEQIVKVAANKVIIAKREKIAGLIESHFGRQRGLRKNELLVISQRHALGEISGAILQQTTLFDSFLDNLVKLPMRCGRFWRSLPTRLSAYRKELYNLFVQSKIMDNNDATDVYKLLDAMDAYATLSNEAGRRSFADRCVKEIAEEMEKRKRRFGENLIAWVKEQRKAFERNVQSNYRYITKHLPQQQTLHNVILQLSGSFAKLECQLLSAIELAKRNGVAPIIGEELGRGGFYSVHAAQWGPEDNLAVKKLLNPTDEYISMAALEAHYHRVVTLVCPDYIVPLLSVYTNSINDHHRELLLIMPRYPLSLRQYLKQHVQKITLARAVSFALIIASALEELHRLEIVHRDLKASNIMLDENEQCYIIDFGTAKFGVSNKTFLGTYPVPPEMIEAYLKSPTGPVRYNGAQADVYSFGLLLFEMVPKPTYMRFDNTTISHPDELLRSIPQSEEGTKDYINLVHACLDLNPGNRPNATKLINYLRVVQKKTESKLCIVCDRRVREIRCRPCGHKATCIQCWEEWSARSNGNARCVLCKAIVTGHTQDDSNATFYFQQH